jgi:hypothetical protein
MKKYKPGPGTIKFFTAIMNYVQLEHSSLIGTFTLVQYFQVCPKTVQVKPPAGILGVGS